MGQRAFVVAWRTIDGLNVRYATGGKSGEKVVLFSPWPESIFAFAPVWEGLTKQFEVLAIDLPGFRRIAVGPLCRASAARTFSESRSGCRRHGVPTRC